jgi:hypothetical protein
MILRFHYETGLQRKPPMSVYCTHSAPTLPPELLEVVVNQPPNVDRKTGARLITQYLFPVSYRSLEAWPLPTRHVNGRAVIPTAKLFEVAYEKLCAAPLVMGGRRPKNQQAVA